MSGLHFLSSQDFSIQKGQSGNILCTSIPGFSLILFYSTHCKFCKDLIPIFKRLPGSISGCQFGMTNVSHNKDVVRASKNTVAPLKYVPYMILYIDGKPFMIYKGPHDGNEIRRFIIDVANNIQKKQEFSKSATIKKSSKNIPEYCTGVPICGDGDDVCYLNETEAYTDRTEKR